MGTPILVTAVNEQSAENYCQYCVFCIDLLKDDLPFVG